MSEEDCRGGIRGNREPSAGYGGTQALVALPKPPGTFICANDMLPQYGGRARGRAPIEAGGLKTRHNRLKVERPLAERRPV